MKCVLVPILLLLMTIQTFSKWVVVIDYNLNRNYIAKNLCVNRARPKMHCNGKCQMMKKLAEEEKQNSSNNSNNTSRIKVQDLVFNDEMNKPVLPALTCIENCYNEEPPLIKYNAPTASIFHPPAIG